MSKLLIPLLAAFVLPTAVNAESHWLIIQITKGGGYNSLEKIEMAELIKSLFNCESPFLGLDGKPCMINFEPKKIFDV